MDLTGTTGRIRHRCATLSATPEKPNLMRRITITVTTIIITIKVIIISAVFHRSSTERV